jgi:hypothetical protein
MPIIVTWILAASLLACSVPTSIPIEVESPASIPVSITTINTTENSPDTPLMVPKKTSRRGDRQEDKYACAINSDGYCISSGIAHGAGLKPNTEDIVDRNGVFLFSMHEAVAVNSAGKTL